MSDPLVQMLVAVGPAILSGYEGALLLIVQDKVLNLSKLQQYAQHYVAWFLS